MNAPRRFSEFPYHRPDRAELRQESEALIARFDAARSPEEQLAVIRAWDAHGRKFSTVRALAEVRFHQDTASEENRAEQEFFDELGPVVLELEKEFFRRVVASPHRPALEQALGAQAFALWECYLTTFEPAIADEKRQEAALRNEYNALLAGIRVPFRGEEHNLSTMRAFFGDADRATRLEAIQALDAALLAAKGDLDRLFHELVAVRHRQAQKLGEATFTPLGYRLMSRTDYSDADVAAFRQTVRDLIVPLCARIRARHAEILGVSDYGYHDEEVRDDRGTPRPQGDHDWMLGQATAMFDEMGEDFAAFFEMMRDRELLDLKSRPAKAGGGFCTSFVEHNVPFIFANFNGTQDDVRVFTHECGHAFQGYSSFDQPLVEYFWPTAEACEVHSMGLELLTFPYMERFFGGDADRFRVGHLEDALLFLPYGTAVDDFQHQVYAAPGASPDDRAAMWRGLEATYLPWRRYEGMPHAESGRLWQRQRHIYMAPFYYIDYCLAQICALQLWKIAKQDREDALARYRKLCQLGGSMPFQALLKEVGLRSPFDRACVEEVVAMVADELGLQG